MIRVRGHAISKLLSMVAMCGVLNLLVVPTLMAKEIAIIVHPDMMVSMSKLDIQRIFLGKNNLFPDGEPVLPIEPEKNDVAHDVFLQKVLKKTPRQIRAYRTKQIFTGRGNPPKQAESTEELLALVASNKRYIAYLSSDLVDSRVRVAKLID